MIDKAKRDTFLLRFKTDSDERNRVIPECNIPTEFPERATDPFW